MGLNLLTVSN